MTHYLNYLWKLTVCVCWQVVPFLLLGIRSTHLQLIHLFHNWGKVNWKEPFSLCTNWVPALSPATSLEALIINHRALSLSTGRAAFLLQHDRVTIFLFSAFCRTQCFFLGWHFSCLHALLVDANFVLFHVGYDLFLAFLSFPIAECVKLNHNQFVKRICVF